MEDKLKDSEVLYILAYTCTVFKSEEVNKILELARLARKREEELEDDGA